LSLRALVDAVRAIEDLLGTKTIDGVCYNDILSLFIYVFITF